MLDVAFEMLEAGEEATNSIKHTRKIQNITITISAFHTQQCFHSKNPNSFQAVPDLRAFKPAGKISSATSRRDGLSSSVWTRYMPSRVLINTCHGPG